jgi:hypothetical protein
MKKLLGEKASKAAWAQTSKKLAPMKEALIAVLRDSSDNSCGSDASTNSTSSLRTQKAS